MVQRITHLLGGYAFRNRELRVMYLACFLSFLGASSIFPIFILYARQQHASATELGLLAGALLLAPLVAQMPLGWLVDHWGRAPVLMFGLLAHPVVVLLYVVFNTPWELIALRFIEGIIISAFSPSINAYIADVTPEEHRAEAYGGFGATLNGGLFAGPLIGGLIGGTFGFKAAFVAAFLMELFAIPVVLWSIQEPKRHIVRHEDCPHIPWSALFTGPLVAVYIGYLCIQILEGSMTALWTLYVHDLGGSLTFIGFTITVFAIPQILLGTASGRVAGRMPRALTMFVGGLLVSLVYVSYGLVTSLVAVLVLGLLEGMLLMVQQPLAQSLLADASPAEARGRAQGLAGMIGSLGGFASAFFAPPLYYQSHALPWFLLGICTVIGWSVASVGAVLYERHHRSPASAEQVA
jgi:MFS family permease